MKRRLILFLPILILFYGCSSRKPIQIGFIGTLTGSFSDIGLATRNTALLAIEEVNARGGVKGRSLELIVRNDEGDVDRAREAVEELIDQGVKVIIGPTTSTMALNLLPVFAGDNVLFVSSTVSTTKLDNLDDNHIKFITASTRSSKFVSLAMDLKDVDSIIPINDLTNEAFANSYVESVRPLFEARGGTLLPTIEFDPLSPSYSKVAEKIIASGAKGTLFLGDNRNTALVCQQLAKKGYDGMLYSNAMTDSLIEHGGSSVENLMMISSYNPQSRNESYLRLKVNYYKRFGQEINFAVNRTYDAMNALFLALEREPSMKELKESFLKRRRYEGVQGELTMNEYGDVDRPMYMFVIKNGEITVLEETL